MEADMPDAHHDSGEDADPGQRRELIASPVGPLVATASASHITGLGFAAGADTPTPDAGDPPGRGAGDRATGEAAASLLDELRTQLGEYFAGLRREFDLPLAARGTEFQMAVWSALRDIPYGRTATYGEVAEAIGRPRAVRAVGGANNANPISIVVPCHRVIGADGTLTGFGGGLEVKAQLLALEAKGADD